MTEQALQDAYTLFQGAGYGKSFDEFVNLINTNDQALGDAYQLFQEAGYGKSLDEFSTLMGVKKKKIRQYRLFSRKRFLRNLPQLRLLRQNKSLEIRLQF